MCWIFVSTVTWVMQDPSPTYDQMIVRYDEICAQWYFRLQERQMAATQIYKNMIYRIGICLLQFLCCCAYSVFLVYLGLHIHTHTVYTQQPNWFHQKERGTHTHTSQREANLKKTEISGGTDRSEMIPAKWSIWYCYLRYPLGNDHIYRGSHIPKLESVIFRLSRLEGFVTGFLGTRTWCQRPLGPLGKVKFTGEEGQDEGHVGFLRAL